MSHVRLRFTVHTAPVLQPLRTRRRTRRDRLDYALEGVSRFTGLFALGMTVTLIARWVPALLPFYWIGAIAAILALVLPAYLSRSARLLAMAIALVVALFSGWFDQITHTSEQVQQQVQQQVKAVLK